MEILGIIHKECAEERKARTQQGIDKKISELKDKFDRGYDKGYKIWLKVKLTCGNLSEHVWISVTDINLKDDTFYGTIDNDIVWVSEKYSCGDGVVIGFNEIEDIIEAGNIHERKIEGTLTEVEIDPELMEWAGFKI